MTTLREAALWYAKNGIPVFPLLARDKKPFKDTRGFLDATTDVERVTHWWTANPQANIGVPMGSASGRVVLDLDPKNGGPDRDAFLEKYGALPETTEVITGGGGRHFYFKPPEGKAVPTRHGEIGKGIDLQGEGSYVVAPPSIHPNGATYVYDGLDAEKLFLNLPLLPERFLVNSGTGKGPAAPIGAKIPKGIQHRELVSLAGTMRHRGLGVEEIFAAISVVNRDRCEVPGPEKNIRRIAESVCKYPPGEKQRPAHDSDDPGPIELGATLTKKPERPRVLNLKEILDLDIQEAEMLIDGVLPAAGASLMVGAAKSGKTLASVQMGIAVSSGNPLYGFYNVRNPGPVLVIEQDDPSGAGSIKTILEKSSVPIRGIPFHLVAGVPYQFGPVFLEWLESEIIRLSIRMAVLDSYTALRGSRPKGVDIVKSEQGDLTQLDAVAKRNNCAVLIIHHSSKGSAGLDWSEKAAGTFAMSAATESQIFISRFIEMEGAAAERLVRIRGRHSEDLEMVLRFRKETLDYEHVLAGGAAPMYPIILQLRHEFGDRTFEPKEISHALGLSRATVHRQIARLYQSGAIRKIGYGEYALERLSS